jgi:hypothetical protein
MTILQMGAVNMIPACRVWTLLILLDQVWCADLMSFAVNMRWCDVAVVSYWSVWFHSKPHVTTGGVSTIMAAVWPGTRSRLRDKVFKVDDHLNSIRISMNLALFTRGSLGTPEMVWEALYHIPNCNSASTLRYGFLSESEVSGCSS